MCYVPRHLTRFLSISFVLIAWSGAALAKLTNISLAELVEGSTVIAYGRSVTDGKSSPLVVFQTETLLKGPREAAQKTLRICNDPADVESYDLSKVSEPYVVFATGGKDCYTPIHGLRSVVQVREGIALTGNISDQPQEQPVTAFIKKVSQLVEHQASK